MNKNHPNKLTDFEPQANRLKNKVILITGSSDGIGRAVAIAYAKYGATIILMGRNTAKLEKTYDQIINANYPKPAIYPLDFAIDDPQHYQAISYAIHNEFGQLDGLLHNAATLGMLSPIEHYNPKHWQRVMQINLNAPFLLTQALLPLMRQSPQANLIFTLAPEAHTGKAYWGAYGASKFALHGLMQTLTQELENTTIRVNAINPGIVKTQLRAKAYPAEDPSTLPTPEQILKTYLYLFSKETRAIHGQCINAQGETNAFKDNKAIF